MKPIRTLLTTLGVALGIALFIGIEIINHSTLASFKESIDAVAGKATLSVSAGEFGFAEDKLEIVSKVRGVKNAVPMIESRAYFAGNQESSETLIVLGVDLLKEQGVRTYKTSDQEVIDDPLVFLNQPDSIIVTRAFAQQHKLKIDDKFELATARGKKSFTVRGLLSPEGPAKAYGGAIAIMDIDGARMTFGKENKLDRIDIITRETEGTVEEIGARVSQALGPGYQVERPETQNENMERLVKTFQTMLTFFSTLALLVGLFLVTNSISIAVAERKREIGTLRALGATRGGILALFLSEAVAMGAIGAFLGAWMGRALASVMVGMVTRSMSSQYLTRIEVSKLIFGPRELGRAVALGAIAAFVAALWPALKATTIQPLEAMRQREVGEDAAGRGIQRYTPHLGLAMLIFMITTTLMGLPARSQIIDVIDQSCAIIGSALLGPALVAGLIRAFRPVVLRTGDTISRLAQDNLLRNPRRTGSNVMSLMVGLILVIMIGTVNVSFRVTLVDWFNRILRADLLVSSSGKVIAYQTQPLHEDLGPELAAIPGVYTEPGHSYGLRFVHLTYQGRQLGMKAYDEPMREHNYSTFDVLDRPAPQAGYELYHSKDPVVMVSENFVLHFHKKTGEQLELDTPSGRISFKIIGVVADFASPEGIIYMDRILYKKYWHDPLVNVFGLMLAPGAKLETVRAEIDRRLGQAKSLTIVSNAEIKQQMISVVDQSFGYTHAIEVAALLVGLLGLLNTLLISVMERMRELGMLRAVGMSKGQLKRLILKEALIQGSLGAVAAAVLGSGIAYLWITYSLAHVLGWMIQFHFPWMTIAMALGIGTLVAAIAGYFPARRASNLEIRDALEYE